MDELRVIEICAGAGGQSLGLERAGFRHELAVDINPEAVATLAANRPGWKTVVGDAADPSVWTPADYAPERFGQTVDLLAGGVPCPPFTVAGAQLGASDERDLLAWMVAQAAVIRPRALMVENVRGLAMPRFAGYRRQILDQLTAVGYAAEWRVLTAADFGVPQLRPRFFLIAMAADDLAHLHWPTPAARRVTVGQALLPYMAAGGWEGADAWAARANTVAPTIVGGSRKHGGPDLGPTRARQAWAALGVNGKGVADHPPAPGDVYEIGPKLTCDMVAAVQGFDPATWVFIGGKTARYRQIGNALPPPVAHAVGAAVAAALHRTTPRRPLLSDSGGDDPVYAVLAAADGHLTAAQIAAATGRQVSTAEVVRRITALGQDFELDIATAGDAAAYRLGRFLAFTGQPDHARHDRVRESRSTIS